MYDGNVGVEMQPTSGKLIGLYLMKKKTEKYNEYMNIMNIWRKHHLQIKAMINKRQNDERCSNLNW